MSAHRYKVAAILFSISGIGVTFPASADEQSVRRGKAIAACSTPAHFKLNLVGA